MDTKLEFEYILGVSAGAMNAVNFVSKQRGRARSTSIDIASRVDLISLKNIFTNQSVFDLEYLFDSLPNEVVPFDYERFFASKTKCEITVTNCNTGRAEFLVESDDNKRLMDILRASTALPFLTPIVRIDDIPYLDGGIADSLPIKEIERRGYKKIVVVLTKPKGYRKEKSSIGRNLSILFYNKYPNLVKSLVSRYRRYNTELEYIEKLEEDGKVFVLRPQKEFDVSRTEKEYEPLMRLYQHGYDISYNEINKMQEYING